MKDLNITTIIVSFTAVIAPIINLLVLVGVVVAIDTIYGIYTAIKKGGFSAFQSHKLFNVVIKLAFYLGSILIAYALDVIIVGDNHIMGIPLLVSKILSCVWIGIELKSIDENSQKNGNKPFMVIFQDFVKTLKGIKKDLKGLKDEVNE